MVVRLFLIVIALLTVAPMASMYVAVLETVSENGVIGRSEKMFLTDKLREQANKALPAYMGYVVMTRENISAMLPAGKNIEDCEGTCLVETGKNISADYVAQARVGKFGNQFTITMELYETAGSNLVGSFTARKPDAEGLLEEIEHESSRIFQQIVGTSILPVDASEGISGISRTTKGFQKATADSGVLILAPEFKGGMGTLKDAEIIIDADTVKGNTFHLPVGNHKVQISHPCYESVTFNATVNNKSKLHFDQDLQPLLGALEINAIWGGSPHSVSVFLNGKKKGNTPYIDTIPICSDVRIANGVVLPLKMKAGKTVKWIFDGNGTVVDKRDNKEYRTMLVNKQVWMKDNLNYKASKSYCYDYKTANCSRYGRLYTWEAAKKACPTGWHLPNLAEWEKLIVATGGNSIAGKKLKQSNEQKKDKDSVDPESFSALLAGERDSKGAFFNKENATFFWSSTEDGFGIKVMNLTARSDEAFFSIKPEFYGLSVRCVMDYNENIGFDQETNP